MATTREARVHLAPDASSIAAGRRFVARMMRSWHVDEARIEPVQLVASELVANAIVHAGAAPVLSLERAGADLLIRVADDSPLPPVLRPRTRPTDSSGGRGLVLVDALADRWGTDAKPAGKIVWAAFAGAFA